MEDSREYIRVVIQNKSFSEKLNAREFWQGILDVCERLDYLIARSLNADSPVVSVKVAIPPDWKPNVQQHSGHINPDGTVTTKQL